MTHEKPHRRMSRRAFEVLAVVILGVVLILSWRAVPRAPHRIEILSGEAGGGYHQLAQRYATFVRARGLEAAVVETAGSLDNLGRLAAGTAASVGFAQSGAEAGLEDPSAAQNLESLGSLAFEPVWLFFPKGSTLTRMTDLVGKRLGLGPRGSGSWAVAELLLAESDLVDRTKQVVLDLDAARMSHALASGEVDAVCVVGAPRSPVVAHLLAHEGVVPVSFPRAAAYGRRHRKLAELTLPEGALDMARNIPATDLRLIALATNLVARDGLHPAAVGLLLEAAREIQHPPTLLAEAGTFPSSRYTSLPVTSAALTYLQTGQQGLLYRLLPFWLAGLVTWLVQLLTPFATVAFFLFKIFPDGIRYRFHLRVRRLFGRLTRLERARAAGVEVAEIRRELDELDRDSVGLSIPRGMASPYFELRQAIHDMRDRLPQ